MSYFKKYQKFADPKKPGVPTQESYCDAKTLQFGKLFTEIRSL
jgi:hypothetical protein